MHRIIYIMIKGSIKKEEAKKTPEKVKVTSDKYLAYSKGDTFSNRQTINNVN